MKKIPKSFEILGHHIDVELRDDLLAESDAWGVCHFHQHKIELQSPVKGLNLAPSHYLATFWYEATHMFLYTLGHMEMAQDEAMVDQIAQAIHQVMKSAKY